MKRKSSAAAEWFVVIVGILVTVGLYHCFEEMTGIKYTDYESVGERAGIIVTTGFLGYIFGAIPAGYMMVHKLIKGTFFTNALLGIACLTPDKDAKPWEDDGSIPVLGLGFFAASIAVPFVFASFTGIFAYPYYLLRRILGIFLHTEERIDKAMRNICNTVMIIAPILGFVLPVLILKGEEGKELGKIVLVACLAVDAVIFFIAANAKRKMKKQIAGSVQ